MFSYGHGRFTSPDPLAASANPIRPQSWNRYSYSYNNPLRYTDPSGMIAGDFYNLKGNKIGTDGDPDGKIYIVYDKERAGEIENTKGDYKGAVTEKFTIDSIEVIRKAEQAVDRSNNAEYSQSGFSKLGKNEKASGGFREAGLSWETNNGETVVTDAPDGDYTDPRVKPEASIALPQDADGKIHIHPSGQIKTRTTIGSADSLGGARTKSDNAKFQQKPTQTDIDNALPGTNAVIGARDKKVYFYRKTGNEMGKNKCNCVANMNLENFLKIGK